MTFEELRRAIDAMDELQHKCLVLAQCGDEEVEVELAVTYRGKPLFVTVFDHGDDNGSTVDAG